MNFYKLIDKYTILIPMIQRDYAQGRKSEERIREDILSCIIKKIDTGLHLDFIYGSVDENLLIFTPLDGQQRLTTLFLLHWYVAARGKHLNEKDKLKKFRYETRISSTDFITALVDSIGSITIKNTSKKKLSEKIKDCTWFFSSWEHDPTVSAMLVMLDAIHEKFGSKIDSLVNLKKITFDFINLDDFKLTDDLYIKMNARGVPLTPFENFKAKFEKILESENLENKLFVDTNETLRNYFSRKIETDWVENFWDYKTEKSICGMLYKTIDEAFMRFFWYITEMLYFKNNLEEKNTFSYDTDGNPVIDYDLINLVYQDSSSVEFLFQSLNNIKILNEKIEETCSYNQDNSGKNRVALFKKEYNFLTRSVENEKLTDYEKLTLFTIVFYVNELSFDYREFTDNLRDLIRVIRNLLHQVREWRDNKAQFKLELDTSKYHLILKAIFNNFVSRRNIYEILSSAQVLNAATEAFKGEYFNYEREKASIIVNNNAMRKIIFKLEDHRLIKGSTHNFYLEDIKLLEGRVRAFFDIWGAEKSNRDREIVESFLGIIDYSVDIWNGHGKFFGGDGGWRSILTFFKKNNKLVKFLDVYNECSSLESIKCKYLLDTTTQKDWRYYFVNYSSMTKAKDYHLLYAWIPSEKNGFSIRHLSQYQFNGYHINPYVRTVINIINDQKICCIDSSRSKTSDRSPLELKKNDFTYKCQVNGYVRGYYLATGAGAIGRVVNGNVRGYYLQLFCEDKGWRVNPALSSINQCSQVKPIEDSNGYFYLKPTETMDMIEVAVAFICELYQLENPLDKNKVVDSYAEVVA
ncbi:DUF262 domain-containing protein [Thiothrix subterranea]|uniref:DUF262 domain-containing protein n=1 Tax=Thiothrix subterranea TaxID=2735563 RepID=UPI00192C4025|nr:DUF262 domain-containing protein [Thiothrix subterranea]QQZ27320.1 DUF262 domain-containing protein [Thiothrix subterranea]